MARAHWLKEARRTLLDTIGHLEETQGQGDDSFDSFIEEHIQTLDDMIQQLLIRQEYYEREEGVKRKSLLWAAGHGEGD